MLTLTDNQWQCQWESYTSGRKETPMGLIMVLHSRLPLCVDECQQARIGYFQNAKSTSNGALLSIVMLR
jgi:hypothetical protein